MSKFNTKVKGKDKVVNFEGGEAYKVSPEIELYSLVCTSILSNNFYESSDTMVARLKNLINQVDPLFVGQLAIYVRTQMYLRSIPLVLIVELAKIHKGDNLISKIIDKVVLRVDEITELLSYYTKANNRQDTHKLNDLSNQIKRGLRLVFESGRFDEYQYAKYNRETEIKIRDALFLVHPKPKDKEQEDLFNKIVSNSLEVPYTWEVELSRAGQEKKSKKEVWESLILSEKLGYMALIRNLRNILEAEVSLGHIKTICDFISNPVAVKKSKLFPFRFFLAYKELINNESFYNAPVFQALENAVKCSIDNIEFFNDESLCLIACDVSGSMEVGVSQKSAVHRYDIGLLLGQLLKHKLSNTLLGIFGDTWKIKNFTSDSVLANTYSLHQIEGEVGYSTNGWKVIEWLNKNKKIVDKIFIFTDCQMWNSDFYSNNSFVEEWNKYKLVNSKAELYLFDLAGYGPTPVSVKSKDVYLIAGWSDRIFDLLKAIKEKESAISIIKKIIF